MAMELWICAHPWKGTAGIPWAVSPGEPGTPRANPESRGGDEEGEKAGNGTKADEPLMQQKLWEPWDTVCRCSGVAVT